MDYVRTECQKRPCRAAATKVVISQLAMIDPRTAQPVARVDSVVSCENHWPQYYQLKIGMGHVVVVRPYDFRDVELPASYTDHSKISPEERITVALEMLGTRELVFMQEGSLGLHRLMTAIQRFLGG